MRLPLLLFLICSLWGWAQPPEELPEIVISSATLSDSTSAAPSAITVLDATELQLNLADISPAVNTVPGVLMQTGSLNTSRISIRGIGARTPFGTNRIRAFYGPIPLTSGDGETTIEDLDVESLGQIEFVRGPRASVHGAGLGGAILISPLVPKRKISARVSSTFGSYGLEKSTYSVSGLRAGIHHHRLLQDGWRQNSSYRRDGTTLTSQFAAGNSGKILLLGNFTSLKAYIPSSINSDAFENNPRSAAPTWLAAKGFEQYRSWMAGAAYYATRGKIKPSVSIFGSGKDAYEPRPFDILDQESLAWGTRGEFYWEIPSAGTQWRFRLGGEYFGDRLRQLNFENLYEENNGNGSLQGQEIASNEQARTLANGFAQTSLTRGRWNFQTGLNINHTRFLNVREGDRFDFRPVWSPEFSVTRDFSLGMAYVSAGRGFSMPSVQETLDASRAFNKNLQPETGINYEAGAKFRLFKKRLSIDAAAFTMDVRNLLVARRIADDQYVGFNAGRSLHQGFELHARFTGADQAPVRMGGYVSGSLGRYTFREFVDRDTDYSGKRMTGVPSSKVSAGISAAHLCGAYAQIDALFLARVPANDANTVFAENYQTVHIRAGWALRILESLSLDLAVGVSNVLDERFASMVQVNAQAAPGQQPRYFYPGMPAQVYTHVKILYR